MQFFDLEQGSDSWWEMRRGRITASRCNRILTPKTGKLSAQADALICELISELYSLIPPENVESYTNRAMRWGQQTEAEARRYLGLQLNAKITNGGFCLSDCGRYGASPDGLIQGEAAVEIKCPTGPTQVNYLLAGTLPDEYRWQCNCHLLVTGLPVCWFLSYSPGLAPLLIRVERSNDTETLAAALELFHAAYLETLEKVRQK
jgi:putative phage-type endonuclease